MWGRGIYGSLGGNRRPFFERNNVYRSTPSEVSSESRQSSRKRRVRRRLRRFAWLTFAVVATLAIAAVMAALVGRNTSPNQQQTQVTTTVATPTELQEVKASLDLDKVKFDPDYLNKTSAKFKELEDKLCKDAMKKSFKLYLDEDALKECKVTSFTQSSSGTVKASFKLAVDRKSLQLIVDQESSPSEQRESTDVADLVKGKLKTAVLQNQNPKTALITFFAGAVSNNSNVDVQPTNKIVCRSFPGLPNNVRVPNGAARWKCSHPSLKSINSRGAKCDLICPPGLQMSVTGRGIPARTKCAEVSVGVGGWVWLVKNHRTTISCDTPDNTGNEGSGDVG